MSSLSFMLLFTILFYSLAQSAEKPEFTYEDEIKAIVEDMSKCMDKNLAPLMAQLEYDDQEMMRAIGIHGIVSFIEHMRNGLNNLLKGSELIERTLYNTHEKLQAKTIRIQKYLAELEKESLDEYHRNDEGDSEEEDSK